MIWVSMPRLDTSGKLTWFAEFLEDENRRRVAAFGYHAGYAGKYPREISRSLSMICPSGSFSRFASYRNIHHLACEEFAILIPFHYQAQQ